MNTIMRGLGTLAIITISFALLACGDSDDNDGGTVIPPPTTAPTAPSALTLTPQSIKNFAFSWNDADGETEYFLLENPDGSSGYAKVATIAANATSHVLDVFLPGRINASYILQACNSNGCVDSAEVFVTGTLAEAVGYVKASNSAAYDLFGVVALSADGNTMVIGAYGEDSNASGVNNNQTSNSATDSGAVYVFSRSGGVWSQQAYVKASNTGAGDQFGLAVALSADGNTLAVGAFREDSSATGINDDVNQADNSVSDSGAVYVFTRDGVEWKQEAYVKASNTDANDFFGIRLALAADGNTLAVGATNEDSSAIGINNVNQADNSASNSGAVYVFTRSGTTWSQQAYVKSSNSEAGDLFGQSVALAGDGNTLTIGADGEDSSSIGINGAENNNSFPASGAVYVFTRDAGAWTQEAYVKASNTGISDGFGSNVALAADGNTMAVGAPGEDSSATGIDGDENDNAFGASGAVYVFTRNAGSWTQEAYVKASNTAASDLFGLALALSDDGNTLAVGASGEDSNATGIDGNENDDTLSSSGAVYVFTRDNGWKQQAYVKASNTGQVDDFGRYLALTGDASTLAVGAPLEDSNAISIGGDQLNDAAENTGAVYLY